MKLNKMKAIRYYLGLSQAEFAKRLNVSAGTVCLVEQGKREMSDYVRAKLAHIEMSLPDDFYIFSKTFKGHNIPS